MRFSNYFEEPEAEKTTYDKELELSILKSVCI